MVTHKPIITIGILLLLSILIIGAGQKFYLNQYEEECYEYQKVPYVANWTFSEFSADCYYWNDYKCKIINTTHFYNLTRNGECIKYHLVRKA